VRKVLISFHLLAAFIFLFGAFINFRKMPHVTADWAMYLLMAFFFVTLALGFYLRKIWLVIIPSIPLIGFAAIYSFIFLVGGWAWGPSNQGTVNALIIGCLLIIVIEALGITYAVRNKHDM